MNDQEKYMYRCLELARNGMGSVSPNPMVGCVIVKDNKIIGEGYHKEYGGPHAEVNAINSVSNKNDLKQSTLYVNLEPCSHHGKTPPCSDMILSLGIPEIVIGQKDPHHLVEGNGIKLMQAAGCKVITGILEKESRELNRRFNIFHEKKRPYIILKWAQTLDGYIDVDRTAIKNPISYWISNYQLKRLVHKWRTEESAIMIGALTAVNDNPRLNAREWPGRNPTRIIIDENMDMTDDLNVLDGSVMTIVFSSKPKQSRQNLEYIMIDFNNDYMSRIMDILYEKNIMSVIVEGGKRLLESYLDVGLWDEARLIIGNKVFHRGLKGPDIPTTSYVAETIDKDKLLIFRNSN